MIITVKKSATEKELERLEKDLRGKGLQIHKSIGDEFNVWGLVGDTAHIDESKILAQRFVANVTRVSAPYKLANRMFHPLDTVVDVSGVKIGANEPVVVMGGP